MVSAELRLHEESLQFHSFAQDLAANIIDPTERPELALARQRLNLSRNARSKLKSSEGFENQKRPESVFARLMQLSAQCESALGVLSCSLESLDSRRDSLFKRRADLQDAIRAASSREQKDSHENLMESNSINDDASTGVLCPYILAGDCIDQSCAYYHPDR